MSSLPTLIDTTPEAELTAAINTFQDITGKTLQKGQPEYLIAASLAYHVYLKMQQMNAAAANMLMDYAVSPMLDYLVALLGVSRTSATPATCTLKFTLVAGHAALTLSAGTRVASSDGQVVFEVDEDTSVTPDETEISVSATCQTDGTAGNDYIIGSINTIMDAQPYISAVTNIDLTANGSDAETDEELRTRAKLASSTFSVAGPEEAYQYFVKSVSPLIVDVAVLTTSNTPDVPPGEVHLYALLKNGQIPGDSLNQDIQNAITEEKIRPMNDTPIVASPTPVHFTIIIEAIKLTSYAGTSNELVSAISTILDTYKTTKYASLGLDIVASEIEALCRISGLYDLNVTITPVTAGYSLTGRNLIIAPNEFGYLDSYTVNISGSNNG